MSLKWEPRLASLLDWNVAHRTEAVGLNDRVWGLHESCEVFSGKTPAHRHELSSKQREDAVVQ